MNYNNVTYINYTKIDDEVCNKERVGKVHGIEYTIKYKHTKSSITVDEYSSMYSIPVLTHENYEFNVGGKLMTYSLKLNSLRGKLKVGKVNLSKNPSANNIEFKYPTEVGESWCVGEYKTKYPFKAPYLNESNKEAFERYARNDIQEPFDDDCDNELILSAQRVAIRLSKIHTEPIEFYYIQGNVLCNTNSLGWRVGNDIEYNDRYSEQLTVDDHEKFMTEVIYECMSQYQMYVHTDNPLVDLLEDGLHGTVTENVLYAQTVIDIYELYHEIITDEMIERFIDEKE